MEDLPNPSNPILVVDDEEFILISYDTALRMAGYSNIVTCQNSPAAMGLVQSLSPEIILMDLTMPDVTGESLLTSVNTAYPDIPVVVITGLNSVSKAVECLKSGAYDYIVKPVENERLLATVKNALSFRELRRENSSLLERMISPKVKNPAAFSDIIASADSKMQAVFCYIEAVAPSSNPVLITGETGSGKELAARAVHKASGRAGDFVAVNAASLDDNMFSDTLFGHAAGAFTGAASNRQGMINSAEGGTLFLDEIGDLSMQSQVKLLRLIQEREYFPLGSDRVCRTSARIVAATNADLAAKAAKGLFRNDLFYRLRAHHINLPPLRERPKDLPVLVDFFLQKAADDMKKLKPAPPRELFPLLASHKFPGNIRELEAMIADAVSLHQSKMLSLDVFKKRIFGEDAVSAQPDAAPEAPESGSVFGEKLPPLKDVQRLLIDEALRRSEGNKNMAASLLHTSRQALNWHLKKSGGAPEE
jgi:DNA-binding NtrC family response regulator